MAQFELLVADAQRQFDVNGKVQHMSFWAYKVMCRSYLPGYQNPPLFPGQVGGAVPESQGGKPQNYIDSGAGYVDYCAWHRYSDFEWLMEQMEQDYPGENFPPLPAKETDATKDKLQDMVSNKSNDNPKLVPFVQARIRHFNLWCQYLMQVHHLHEASHLKAFIAMEEPQWVQYKETVKREREAKQAPIGSRVSSFFSKVAKPKSFEYAENSELGQIAMLQSSLSQRLKMCMYRMRELENAALNQNKLLSPLAEQFAVNAGKPLPYPLATNGHFVAHQDKTNGVVRHVDEFNYAYVDWTTIDPHTGRSVSNPNGLDRIPVTDLTYSPSGVADPAIFAAMEAINQMESFFAYIQHRADARELEKLVDLMWFWHAFGQSISDTIHRLEKIETKRLNVAEELNKADGQKRAAKQQEHDDLLKKFQDAEVTFKKSYAFLVRPTQRKAHHHISILFGKLSHGLLSDDEWPNRLARCDRALVPDFEVPAEVATILEKLANGEAPPGVSTTAPRAARSGSEDAPKPKDRSSGRQSPQQRNSTSIDNSPRNGKREGSPMPPPSYPTQQHIDEDPFVSTPTEKPIAAETHQSPAQTRPQTIRLQPQLVKETSSDDDDEAVMSRSAKRRAAQRSQSDSLAASASGAAAPLGGVEAEDGNDSD